MKRITHLAAAVALVTIVGCSVAPVDPVSEALAASVLTAEIDPVVATAPPTVEEDGDDEKAAAGKKSPDMASLLRRIDDLERAMEVRSDDDDAPAGDAAGGSEAGGEDDATGTDPRSFGTKFMPYYRYTKLDNKVVVNEFVLFGLVRFNDNVAVTYEIPIAKQMDYAPLKQFANGMGVPSNPGMGFPPGGVPFSDFETDGDVTAMGDAIFRFMAKSDSLRTKGLFGEDGQLEVMPILEVTVPTATNDVLGGETFVISPGFAVIMDMPAMGFLALMNFYDFDAWRDASRDNISRFRGRWFYMQPLTPPAFMAEKDPEIPNLGLLSGLYLLPEAQPVYDFRTDDFSFWVAPEIGKIIREGLIFYAKPGWGIDLDPFDRKFTFEAGMRWFF